MSSRSELNAGIGKADNVIRMLRDEECEARAWARGICTRTCMYGPTSLTRLAARCARGLTAQARIAP